MSLMNVYDEVTNSIVNVTRHGHSYNSDYNISIVADWFHSIPHLDIKLNRLTNTTFDPNDNEYLESLGILVALPGFWLILTLLFFLIFFLCRCCDAHTKKKKKLTCCKLCLFLFAIISGAIISVGIFGSWLSHNGVMKVQNATKDASDVVNGLKNDSVEITEGLDRVNENIDELLTLIDRSPLVRNSTAKVILVEYLYSAKRNLTKGIKKINEVIVRVDKFDPQIVPDSIEKFEQIRCPSTFALLGSLAFICLILIWGILRHSRCVLILFSVLGLLSLVICWVITSVYLGISVAGSDFCVNPEPFIQKQLNGVIESVVYEYYLECDDGKTNPFSRPLRDAAKALDYVDISIDEILEICGPSTKIPQCRIGEVSNLLTNSKINIQDSRKTLSSITGLIDCNRIHNDYANALTASCKHILEGVALMLVSAAASGLCFTLLVLCASHTWINIRKKRPITSEPTDETDPFLPPASSTSTTSSANSKRMRDPYGSGSSGRPRFSHTPPQTPHFPPPSSTPPSAANGRSVIRDDHLSFLSPPPAYEQVHSHQGPHYVVSYRKN